MQKEHCLSETDEITRLSILLWQQHSNLLFSICLSLVISRLLSQPLSKFLLCTYILPRTRRPLMGWKRALTKGGFSVCKGFIIKLNAKPNNQRLLVGFTFQLLERQFEWGFFAIEAACKQELDFKPSMDFPKGNKKNNLSRTSVQVSLSKYHNNVMNNCVKKSCNMLPRLLKPDVQRCWVCSTSHDLKWAGVLRHIYYLPELGTEKTILHVLFSLNMLFHIA